MSQMINIPVGLSGPQQEKARQAEEYYSSIQDSYARLTLQLKSLLEGILEANGVKYLSVSSRLKDRESYIAKSTKDKYKNPTEEISDLIGNRIILYKNSDVKQVCKIIEDNFNCIADQYADKHDDLGTERVGYISIHYVCTLPQERTSLVEFRAYSNVRFEIQIRTVLQHAWADINHGSVYKSRTGLPDEILRRFSLLAGLLELADREFDSIDVAIDRYVDSLGEILETGNLDIDINLESVSKYLDSLRLEKITRNERDQDGAIIDEIMRFGLTKISDLHHLMNSNYQASVESGASDTIRGLFRDIMMLDNIDLYFEKAWNSAWGSIDLTTIRLLLSKYDIEKIYNILSQRQFDLSDEDGYSGIDFEEIGINGLRNRLR